MKVRVVFSFDEEERKAIAHFNNETGKASHADCCSMVDAAVKGDLESMLFDMRDQEGAQDGAK